MRFTSKNRKDYNDFSKEELVKEANSLRIYLERFIENCSSNEQQGQLISITLESDLSIIQKANVISRNKVDKKVV